MVFIVLAMVVISHLIFVMMPGIFGMSFFHVLRPGIYVGLWLLLCIVAGREKRPIYKGQHSTLMVGFGIATYITLLILMGMFFGFARNVIVPNTTIMFQNFWMFAPFAVCQEILRHRIIRDARIRKSFILGTLVTAIFIFTQINNVPSVDVFFSVTAPIIMLNVALSYLAVDGTLTALILLRMCFGMAPILVPTMPNVPPDLWALLLHLILFMVIFLYRKFMPENQNKRRVIKPPFLRRNAGIIIVFSIILSFSLGFFPIFPSVVVTDSMTGSVDRGSVALMRRNFYSIEVGQIIQFRNERNLLVVHRVVDINFDMFGQPVFTTQGDANDRPDTDPVRLEQVTGVVFGRLRHIGMVRVWFNQLFGHGV